MVDEPKTKQEIKLYKCQQCNKEVVADDYNFYFQICISCENRSGNNQIH